MWFQVAVVVGLAAVIGGVFGLQKAIDKLQAQVEHLHNVMLREFEKRE
jgi:hypothetical protein